MGLYGGMYLRQMDVDSNVGDWADEVVDVDDTAPEGVTEEVSVTCCTKVSTCRYLSSRRGFMIL